MQQLNLTNNGPATTATARPPLFSVTSSEREQPAAVKPATKKGGKRKMPPGCGLLDWIRLCRKEKDLAGTGGENRKITEEELAKHCTEDDAWTAIKGIFHATDGIFHVAS